MELVPSKRLAELTPADTQRVLAQCVKLEPNIQIKWTNDHEIIGYKSTGPIKNKEDCLAKAEASLRPAPKDVLFDCLERVYALTASRQPLPQKEFKAKVAIMVDELAKYPADLVVNALLNWHNHSKWAPEVSDIAAYIKQAHTARKSLVSAIKNAPDKPPEKPKGRKWHELSDDEKAAHEQKMHEAKERLKKVNVNVNFVIDT